MITLSTEGRTQILRVRTNRRTRWQYAEYEGRWETVEKAIAVAKDRYGDRPFEYKVEDWETGEGVTGLVNWNK